MAMVEFQDAPDENIEHVVKMEQVRNMAGYPSCRFISSIWLSIMRTRYTLYGMNANTNKMKMKVSDRLKPLSMDGAIEEVTYYLL